MAPATVAEGSVGPPPSARPPAPLVPFAPPAPGPGAFLRRHRVLIYFVLVFALSWGAMLPVTRGPLSVSGNDLMANPLFLIAILAGPLAPAAACLLLTGLLDGRAGYRELLRRLGRWRVLAARLDDSDSN
jgi:CAAX protease family protein